MAEAWDVGRDTIMAAGLQRLSWFNHINVYLLDTPRGAVLVDSAAPGMFGWLRRRLRSAGLTPERLAGVVVTHFHIDHVGTAMALKRRGVPMYALETEVPILKGQIAHPGYGGRAGKALLALELAVFGAPAFSEVSPLEPGRRIFASPWRTIAVPGHTPGSLALFNEDTGDLLSGDTLVSDFGWPRGPHPLFTADYDRAARSALELLELDPACIHPGHGKPLPRSSYDRVHARLLRWRDPS